MLSMIGVMVSSAMGSDLLAAPRLLAAIVVVPIVALSVFMWATLHEHRQRTISLVAYLVVIAIPAVWIVLTR
ncbi:MAG: hypothetical protein CFE37_01905 [Alphaproteobacteria bacterium PA4]|nr:MAG: hypothetical protein CFE37_01905 [Alphaproteobacteria bacterium PA4]